MLVLSRHIEEEIVIMTSDGQIIVKILDTQYGKVRLGIEAPKEIRIARRELLEGQDA